MPTTAPTPAPVRKYTSSFRFIWFLPFSPSWQVSIKSLRLLQLPYQGNVHANSMFQSRLVLVDGYSEGTGRPEWGNLPLLTLFAFCAIAPVHVYKMEFL